MERLAHYQNGNYHVTLYDDGTKIKETQEDEFHADFPDSMDLKITNACDLGCPMCHENALPTGEHCRFDADFLSTLQSGTELAIGGGNPLCHPQLKAFLLRMKAQGVICNMTVNETHLLSQKAEILSLLEEGLIHGLGVSLVSYSPETVAFAHTYQNTVFHLICGLVTPMQMAKLYDRDLKILFLGYKRHGRGETYYSERIEHRIHALKRALPCLAKRFAVVSFDNLAITQLDVRHLVSPKQFEDCFMGNDGDATLYVDLVKREFGLSSTAKERYPILPTAGEMLMALQAKRK